jgi:hypothetical protein
MKYADFLTLLAKTLPLLRTPSLYLKVFRWLFVFHCFVPNFLLSSLLCIYLIFLC